MKEITYGYLLGDDIKVDIGLGAITKMYFSRRLNYYTAEAIFIGDTAMQLLVYLLERAEHKVVTYSDILHDVWDQRDLVSSYKRLNQVISELRDKLEYVGLPSDFIITIRGQGYQINRTQAIKCLYSKLVVSGEDESTTHAL
ncbi:winged helix-turn-helix domain-containing protein [Serratia fonticola]|uniref:winged helix-turn-helix domain-containing protein n=1 Tax=Serratia fonticola TaxID=47917 RepID=UPI00192D1D2D|nr:helix-turn-helix domain-containing protein [Serratia fonticola]MBL5825937.1 winged helix-turn-helix domain-containing protein [Serratia fonticola]